ncbi:DUF7144 family membrane protein [Cellulomonas sp. NPDC055163]
MARRGAGGAGRRAGWTWFAAPLVVMTGLWGTTAGLVAAFSPRTVLAWTDTSLPAVDVSTWGWGLLAASAPVLVVGVSRTSDGAGWARAVASVVIALVLLLRFTALPITPGWPLAAIALCSVVLWALVVNGDELHDAA